MADTRVDLPADEDIKQLAHDVVRDENEYTVPLLRDFYTFLSALDEDKASTLDELRVTDEQSGVGGGAWVNFLDTLKEQSVVEEGRSGGRNTYTLASDD
ncbi:hypothetical protein [Halorubrum sp. SD683]|uniref:hypothetical protein n=1 Tax=Halorubrum sp. SD683 TaxID=1855873 RepID=UPI000A2E5DBE|nr:hypothetical protein [Halorubrum sp. SD683]OTF01856.1 hypothetical protein B9G49_01000 [Halorubrum sp. SD683]